MSRARGRRPLAYHHEAGHAVVRWWLDFHGDDVVVLTIHEVQHRRPFPPATAPWHVAHRRGP